jgi:hypothetical protein
LWGCEMRVLNRHFWCVEGRLDEYPAVFFGGGVWLEFGCMMA